MSFMTAKTAKKSITLLALTVLSLLPSMVWAQAAPSVRELVPPTAPAGARVLVTGRGLDAAGITVAFTASSGTASAAIVQRTDRFLEVIVPSNAATGPVQIASGATAIGQRTFTLAADPALRVTTLAGGPVTHNDVFKMPYGAAVVLPDGRIAVADAQHYQIALVTPAGAVSVLAGSGKQGDDDGKGAAAQFKDPQGITFDEARGVLYVADSGNHTIREVALDGTVKTLAGSGKSGYEDGTGAAAEFNDPIGLTVGADGAIYVADTKNSRIRKVTTAGVVTTFAGNGVRADKWVDGAALSASFFEPQGIVAQGNVLWVADTKNNAIRKIAGGQVTTVFSSPRTGEGDDPADDGITGNPKILNRPVGLGIDESGDLVVADSENDMVKLLTVSSATPSLVLIAGTGKNGHADGPALQAQFKDPSGLAVAGAIYIADEDNDALRVICPDVRVTGLFVPAGKLTAGTEVRVFGTGFVPGATTVKFGGTAATSVTWVSSTELLVKLPEAITGGSVAVTITSCGGSAGPTSFVVDNTPPQLTITNAGAAFPDNSTFKVPVTPVLTATDDFDPSPTITATLNGAPYTSNTTITADGLYTLVARAEDAAGNRTDATIHFTIDATAPVVEALESTNPFLPNQYFNRPVVIDLKITDLTATTSAPLIDGQPYTLKAPYAVEGAHSFSATVTDALLNVQTVAPIPFTIDLTKPVLTFTSHTAGQVVGDANVVIAGTSDDAVTVKVNGVGATVDTTAKTFTSAAVTLVEGDNTITASGTDRAGNTGTATLKLVLDSRAPELTVSEPLANACVKGSTLLVKGTVLDANVDAVTVTAGASVINATLDAARRAWTATVPLTADGSLSLLVQASDKSGHTASRQLAVRVDTKAPVIEISEGGVPLAATLFNRPVAVAIHTTDADPNVTVTSTLDGAAYTSGSEIAAEGAHTISVTATDCAGNETPKTATFTIDRTPPKFLTFNPANGSRRTDVPASLAGTVDNDAVEVRVAGSTAGAQVTNGAYSLSGVSFADGVNELTLEATDRAGNVGRASYTLAIRTSDPLVDIIENGEPMVDNTTYTRAVQPSAKTFEEGVTATMTLDGAAFTSGTSIDAAGVHTLVATATDPQFGRSRQVTRHFTIDRSGPAVAITSPSDGATLNADRVDVRVTAGDSQAVAVNGIGALKGSDGSWTAANVPLEYGENTITAIGRDAAGNSGSASITVTRGNAGPAIILTFPPNPYRTNRPRLDVVGRVLRPSTVSVTVPPAAAVTAATDPAGVFRVTGATVTEGTTKITATATGENGQSTSVSTTVIADFTPPRLALLESGKDLADNSRFATQALLTATATDDGQPVAFTLTIDGNAITVPATITATGGHAAVLTARDDAGNESRLERTFFIGSAGGAGCRLEGFDPADGTVVTSDRVELTGRSGGAAGVKVNGVDAKMSNGSFCVNVALTQEGPNPVSITCTDAAGTPTGDPVSITLIRSTGSPSITITTPTDNSVSLDERITVTGTLGNGAVSVDVNGTPATITGSTWSAANVRLIAGLNNLVAHAKNAGGRTASASVRVLWLKGTPALTITSPIPGFVTGTPSVDVTGTWSDLDPSSLAVANLAGAVVADSWSDTTGGFRAANVPLQSGDNTITVTGRDRAGRLASASVTIKYLSTSPTVTIASPADNHFYGADKGEKFTVEGSYVGGDGAQIDVASVAATLNTTAKTFTAEVPFSNLPNGATPVVARLTMPNGDSAFDSIRVFKLAAAPKVVDVFPATNAVEVDPGVVLLVLFSAPMDRGSLTNAFSVTSSSGTNVSGTLLLDNDVLTFAPAIPLAAGERYTIKVSTAATDLAGQPLATNFESSFITATSAPTGAPTITTASGAYCGQTIDVNGTTSVPGARIRIDYGTLVLTTTSSATGAFSYKVALSGQSGFQVIRVRTMGADGTLSAAAELKLNVDCTGPTVLNASYDRNVNLLTIVFSRDVKASSLTMGDSVQLVLSDDRVVAGTISVSGANAVVTPAENLGSSSFTLKVSTDVVDTLDRKLAYPYTQEFTYGEESLAPGEGRITGEVYDATTGRPLAGAQISIEVPTSAFSRTGRMASNSVAAQAVTITTDGRGRYSRRLPEGAHTIRATANGYTTAWRQIIVPAGAGVTPIDIRLAKRGEAKSVASGALTLTHGANNAITRKAELTIPAGGVTAGTPVTLTSVGAQSLAGLLPLGWSPLASAEIVSTSSTLTGSLSFEVPAEASGVTLTAARYDDARDEWNVVAAVVTPANGKATFNVDRAGAYALVYGDKLPGLTQPPAPITGAPLQGVADPCAKGLCDELVADSFPLDPPLIDPTGDTTATLNIKADREKDLFPSGTAVQAYIDEELRLADGGRELDPPFATDLLLYRDLAGKMGVASFKLAPSPRAAQVFLEVGFENIRILPYPGRLDRGTQVGPEGGRVPGDEKVALEIPTGATTEALLATASTLTDPNALGPVAGYTIVGGMQLTLQRSDTPETGDNNGDGEPDGIAPVELTVPARATFVVDPSVTATQLILVELLDQTPFNNRIYRLAAELTKLDGNRWQTVTVDRNRLPLDGIVREGRYLLLAPNAPIGFAKGLVRLGTGGVATANARVTAPGLGVADLSRTTGIFSIPVPATPATGFSLVPRSAVLGDGKAYEHSPAPAVNEVFNVGDLVLTAEPPRVTGTVPSNNATNVSLMTTVEATFEPGIDGASVNASSITLVNTRDGSLVKGSAQSVGSVKVVWKLADNTTLQPGTRYIASVAPTVRGTNGTPLAGAVSWSFTTAAVVTNSEIHTDRIRITIPENGIAQITGDAGALKTGWIAVPVRRGNDFLTRYTDTAKADGSFAITIGTDPRDHVTIADLIDLHVLDGNGALAAIVALTPFVSPDGRAFVAPANTAVTFTSADGIKVVVPAGAFDTATMIAVKPATADAFSAVPRLDQELSIAGAVSIEFEGRAKQRLDVSIPVANPSGQYFLGVMGQSVLGPRIQAVDMLFANASGVTTVPPTTTGNAQFRVVTNSGVSRNVNPRDFMQGVIEAGKYAAMQMKDIGLTNGFVYALMDTLSTIQDLFWDTMYSMYVGHRYVAEAQGRVAFPVPAGTKFKLTGVDPATALVNMTQTYDPIPLGDPAVGVVIASPQNDVSGPYPVFASPNRVETAEAPPAGVAVKSIRNIQMTLTAAAGSDTGTLHIENGTPALSGNLKVSAIDVNTGVRGGPGFLPIDLPDTRAGDRIVVVIDEEDVDPSSPVSIVFSEPIDVNGATSDTAVDTELKKVIKFEQLPASPSGSNIDLAKTALLRLDSTGRRVTILIPSALAAGEKFRVTLDKTIHDRSNNGLQLAQPGEKDATTNAITPIGPAAADITFTFKTRGPKGYLGQFDIRQSAAAQFGSMREIAQYGNLLFVAALDGGILAYDISDPAKLTQPSPLPIAIAPGHDETQSKSVTDYWTVQIDHHGRVFTTGQTNMFGVLRSFRVEDFIAAKNATTGCLPNIKNTVCKISGSTITSQNPGTAYGVGLASEFVVSDRVEAIPRKVKILVGDAKPEDFSGEQFMSAFGSGATDVGQEMFRFDANVPASGAEYRIQRITVENVTLGLKWSADAKAVSDAADLPPAEFHGLLARKSDTLRVTYNRNTYAIVTLFGWGIGIFDMNAVESNERPQVAGTQSIDIPAEQIAIRHNAFDNPAAASAESIADLSFSPESALATAGQQDAFRAYALDTRKGVVEFSVEPPTSTNRIGESLITLNPRWATLKAAIEAAGHANPYARFNAVDVYHNTNTNKDYLLITALDYGLVVVEAGLAPLGSDSLADVIWLPNGARAVRVIEKSNMAVVVDGAGYAMLVDLSRIDERSTPGLAPSALFPTAAAALAGMPSPPMGGYGALDARVIWHSTTPIAGQIPPVVDADTGMLYGAELLGQRVGIASAIDPKLRFVIDSGDNTGLKDVTSIVPLGIQPPPNVLKCNAVTDDTCRGSMGVFRVEATLPGSIAESLGGSLNIAVETERVAGADAPQTPDPLPVSHLRMRRRDGSNDLRTTDMKLHRVLDISTMPELRYQKGYNKYVSDWIVAIADPRAAKDYDWGSPNFPNTQKEDLGCFACNRPAYVKDDVNAKELYTNGRFIAIRPDFTPGGPYGWLGENGRFRTRASTVMADTVRPTSVLVAPQNAPAASGMLLETTYLHSGEIETSSIDLDAGGRAGWNVVLDRTYRSRTIGLTPMGFGWDAGIFKRLRALPTGDVEYRDGSGEVYLYHRNGTDYDTPKGYFARLARTDGGWVLSDQKRRLTYFDDFGRVVREGDEFYQPNGNGNQIIYTYDGEGRLDAIIDPNNRSTRLTYKTGAVQQEGLLDTIRDWRTRLLKYTFDANGRLEQVDLPQFISFGGVTSAPQRKYAYDLSGGTGSYSDKLELSTNLKKIIEPDGAERVTFTYTGPRDHVQSQKWATGESATFTFPNATDGATSVTDVLGQVRNYTYFNAAAPSDPKILSLFNKRTQIHTIEETNVEMVKDVTLGTLPASITAGGIETETKSRNFDFTYDAEGLLLSSTVKSSSDPGSTTTYGYQPADQNFGELLQTVSISGGGGSVSTTFGYDGMYLATTSANGQLVNTPEARRGLPNDELVETNDAVTTTTKFDMKTGLPKDISTSGGNSGDNTNTTVHIDYPATQPSQEFKRGLPTKITTGGSTGLVTTYDYLSASKDRVDDTFNMTETTYDEWRRPILVVVTNMHGDPLRIEEQFDYDINGRLHEHRRKQRSNIGEDTVITTYEYDALGRTKSVKTNNVAINGSPSEVTETTDYTGFASGTIKSDPPGPTETTTHLDKLGRVRRTEQLYDHPISLGTDVFIKTKTEYDVAGNAVYSTDEKNATAAAFDGAGRAIDVLNLDGTKQHFVYDGWNRVKELHLQDASGGSYYTKKTTYSPAGKVLDVTESGTGGQRKVDQRWDAAGRPVRIAATATGATDGGRATKMKFDPAGRLSLTEVGEGTIADVLQKYDITVPAAYGTTSLAHSVAKSEPKATTPATYTVQREFDTLGRAKRVNISVLEWKGRWNQQGDLISGKIPGQGIHEYDYDSQGRLTREQQPDGSVKTHQFNDTGAKVLGIDEESEDTHRETDYLGRTTRIKYKDNSTEEYQYDGSRLMAIKNRQDQWQSFYYNNKGQIEYVCSGPTCGPLGAKLDQIHYDSAGRVEWWRTKDSLLEYSNYTFDGLPQTTKLTRFKGGSGFDPSTAILDGPFTVGHTFNGYGELLHLDMPSAPATSWISALDYKYDALGNVIELKRNGEVLVDGAYRNARRPESRTVHIKPEGCTTASCIKDLLRTYSYKSDTSQLDGMIAKLAGTEIAGSHVEHNDTLKVQQETLKGVANGDRVTRYTYDNRGRLFGSVTGVSDSTQPPAAPGALDPSSTTTPSTPPSGPPSPAGSTGAGVSQQILSPADFRHEQTRTQQLTAAERQRLEQKGIDPNKVDPPSAEAEPKPGHKIGTFKKFGPTADDFKWERPGGEGGVRTEDGKFLYRYDEKQRLTAVIEKSNVSAIRGIFYTYDGNGRLIGRTAMKASSPIGPWDVENRSQIIAADGVPAEMTFVWDPVTDRLLAVYQTGASASSTDPNGNLLKQFIHGDLGLDDPLEITTIDTTTTVLPPGGGYPVTKLYPVYDEAGNGSLQVVVNRNGEIVARNIQGDPYGAENFELAGAAIDRVTIKTEKDNSGALKNVHVEMRSTETLSAATIAAGSQLSFLGANGSTLAAPVAGTAVPSDAYSIQWTLTPAQWNAITAAANTAGGGTLSIAATPQLRAQNWGGDVQFLPAVEWAGNVYTAGPNPVDVRHPIADVTTLIASTLPNTTSTSTPYEVPGIAMLGSLDGSEEQALLLSAQFQAQPFADPATGKNYVRARWYDPETGTWLSPDPLGDVDSSNLYAFAGGDPINGRDPSGEYAESGHYYTVLYVALRLGYSPEVAQRLAFFTQAPDELGEFDAVENWESAQGENLGNIFRRKNKTAANARMAENERAVHSLTGGDSAEGTKRAVASALAAPDIPELGFQLHRLGDTFAHRQLGNEQKHYETGMGHGAEANEGLSPDTIQRRPELYLEYVRTLATVLAQRAHIANPDIDKIVKSLAAVAYATTDSEDNWYRMRIYEDKDLEEEALATIRNLITAYGQRQGQNAQIQKVLKYQPEELDEKHRTPDKVLRELQRSRGQSGPLPKGLTPKELIRAHQHAIKAYQQP